MATPTEKFIEKARAKHGDKYTYERVTYTHSTKRIPITCPKHGTFIQLPSIHLNGSGCPTCAKDRYKLQFMTQEEFLADVTKAPEFVNYDFSEAVYVRSSLKVTVICSVHGRFQKTPNALISRRSGCPECGKVTRSERSRIPLGKLLVAAIDLHGDKYDYTLISNYQNTQLPVPIRCKKHNRVFNTSMNAHINNAYGCPTCKAEEKALLK